MQTDNIAHKVYSGLRKNFLSGAVGYVHEIFNICCKYDRMDIWHGICPQKINPRIKRIIGFFLVGCPFFSRLPKNRHTLPFVGRKTEYPNRVLFEIHIQNKLSENRSLSEANRPIFNQTYLKSSGKSPRPSNV